jgi:ubiquinone/menaquinone biosynthesis C-methylase UbiE
MSTAQPAGEARHKPKPEGKGEGGEAPSEGQNRSYYDEFAARYEAARRPNDAHGYHALIDDLEIDLVHRHGEGREVLEVGCGTGLLLERIAGFARRAEGVDLSPGMLEKARARGLAVREASATELPYADASFDVACSFKVLAHVPAIERALAEMARVTRFGGVVLAEFYNPWSLRALAKRLGPPGAVSARLDESAVYTRFDSPARARALCPPGCRFEGSRGIRIVTPAAAALRVPGLGAALKLGERALCDSPLRVFGGFWVAVYRKL